MADSKPSAKGMDLVSREKKPSPLGTSVFIGLRAADVVLQYFLYEQGWANRLVSALGGTPVVSLITPATTTYFGGMAPYPALLTLLAAGTSVKQIVHLATISEQAMPVAGAAAIAGFNTAHNTINTLLSCWALTCPAAASTDIPLLTAANLTELITSTSPLISLGVGLYALGTTTELVAEVQRKLWKAKPENKGKPYGGGLWSMATNINYGGYTIMRAGYALAAGGPVWGAVVAGFFFYDFTTRAIPVMDQYCSQKVRSPVPPSLPPFPLRPFLLSQDLSLACLG